MAAIKSLDTIATKWSEVTPQRTPQYIAGIEAPRVDWAQATKAATDNWATGVQAAIQAKRFTKGVDRAGTDKWKRGATTKGPGRWAEGVQLGRDDYGTGFAPFREAIANLNLPPRFARRDPRNIERVRAIVAAMQAVKDRIG